MAHGVRLLTNMRHLDVVPRTIKDTKEDKQAVNLSLTLLIVRKTFQDLAVISPITVRVR